MSFVNYTNLQSKNINLQSNTNLQSNINLQSNTPIVHKIFNVNNF